LNEYLIAEGNFLAFWVDLLFRVVEYGALLDAVVLFFEFLLLFLDDMLLLPRRV